jgi:hypothetical protein
MLQVRPQIQLIHAVLYNVTRAKIRISIKLYAVLQRRMLCGRPWGISPAQGDQLQTAGKFQVHQIFSRPYVMIYSSTISTGERYSKV